jgi:hypothetical protein
MKYIKAKLKKPPKIIVVNSVKSHFNAKRSSQVFNKVNPFAFLDKAIQDKVNVDLTT